MDIIFYLTKAPFMYRYFARVENLWTKLKRFLNLILNVIFLELKKWQNIWMFLQNDLDN